MRRMVCLYTYTLYNYTLLIVTLHRPEDHLQGVIAKYMITFKNPRGEPLWNFILKRPIRIGLGDASCHPGKVGTEMSLSQIQSYPLYPAKWGNKEDIASHQTHERVRWVCQQSWRKSDKSWQFPHVSFPRGTSNIKQHEQQYSTQL